jgi:hypothetical protein
MPKKITLQSDKIMFSAQPSNQTAQTVIIDQTGTAEFQGELLACR